MAKKGKDSMAMVGATVGTDGGVVMADHDQPLEQLSGVPTADVVTQHSDPAEAVNRAERQAQAADVDESRRIAKVRRPQSYEVYGVVRGTADTRILGAFPTIGQARKFVEGSCRILVRDYSAIRVIRCILVKEEAL